MSDAFVRDVRKWLDDAAAASRRTAESDACVIALVEIATAIADALRAGGKVLVCGNGGSAADSQHIATELIVRLQAARPRRPLPAIALTTDTSILTACSNDFSFDEVFSRQVEGLGNVPQSGSAPTGRD